MRCLLFNLVGGKCGTSTGCDSDHLSKRFFARIKSAKGIFFGKIQFTKTNIVDLISHVGIVDTAEDADRLFNQDDFMCMLETSECIYAVGHISTMPMNDFPHTWQSNPANKTVYKGLYLVGRVSKLMFTLIVGHEGGLNDTDGHLLVSGYLTDCATLSHVLYFMFRHRIRQTSFQHSITVTGKIQLRKPK